MQNEMRDRIAEIIRSAHSTANPLGQYGYAEADALIANGVILPLVKVGDIVYTIEKYCNTDSWETEKELVHPWDCENYCGRSDCSFMERRIEEHRVGTPNFALRIESYVGEAYFLTREAAEEKLREKAK